MLVMICLEYLQTNITARSCYMHVCLFAAPRSLWSHHIFLLNWGWTGARGGESPTSSLFLEPRKCRATCSGSMLVTRASFQRLISYTFSFCSWTSIFHRNSVRASFSTSRQQHQLMLAPSQLHWPYGPTLWGLKFSITEKPTVTIRFISFPLRKQHIHKTQTDKNKECVLFLYNTTIQNYFEAPVSHVMETLDKSMIIQYINHIIMI